MLPDMTTMLMYAVAGFTFWAIVDPRFPTGILGTLGLVLIFAGTLAAIDDYANLQHAYNLRAWGYCIAGWNMLWQIRVRALWLECANRWHIAYVTARFWGLERRRQFHRPTIH